jgi:hypothetical protein
MIKATSDKLSTQRTYRGDLELKSTYSGVVVGLYLVIGASGAVADDFRDSTWGDSIESVKESAGEPAQSTEDTLVYKVSIKGLDAVLIYQFTAGKLTSAGYLFTESHSNKNLYISDYSTIHGLVNQKYGKPESNDAVWLNDLYRDDPSNYGTAVSIGHYVKQAIWETERTKIMHTLRGDNFEITHGINYLSKELESLSEETKEKEAMDQL